MNRQAGSYRNQRATFIDLRSQMYPNVNRFPDHLAATPLMSRLYAEDESRAVALASADGDSGTVLRRPHFRLVGKDLVFLISRQTRLHLSGDEADVWNFIGCGRRLEEIRGEHGARGEAIVDRLVNARVCEIAPSKIPSARRRVVVIEPHSDDAVLSVGGTMWLRRQECEFIVITIASRSNFTSYFYLDRDYFRVDEITALRNAEAALFVRMLGGRHIALNQPEATLRYQDGDWSLDWYRRHRSSVAAFIAHRSGSQELRTWMRKLREALLGIDGDEVWMPLGVGPHTDHELARNACLSLFDEDPALLGRAVLRMYQEVPYAARTSGFTESIVHELAAAGAKMHREPVAIDSIYERKLHLMSLYASQFKVDAVRPEVEASARRATGGPGLAELFWRVDRLPAPPDPIALYVGAPVVRQASGRFSTWASHVRRHQRIRLVLLAPAGRLSEDLECLLRAFPSVHIDLWVSRAAAAEAETARHPRVTLTVLETGAASYSRCALRLAFAWWVPSVLLTGSRRFGAVQRLVNALPFGRLTVLPTMDHLVITLREVTR